MNEPEELKPQHKKAAVLLSPEAGHEPERSTT